MEEVFNNLESNDSLTVEEAKTELTKTFGLSKLNFIKLFIIIIIIIFIRCSLTTSLLICFSRFFYISIIYSALVLCLSFSTYLRLSLSLSVSWTRSISRVLLAMCLFVCSLCCIYNNNNSIIISLCIYIYISKIVYMASFIHSMFM